MKYLSTPLFLLCLDASMNVGWSKNTSRRMARIQWMERSLMLLNWWMLKVRYIFTVFWHFLVRSSIVLKVSGHFGIRTFHVPTQCGRIASVHCRSVSVPKCPDAIIKKTLWFVNKRRRRIIELLLVTMWVQFVYELSLLLLLLSVLLNLFVSIYAYVTSDDTSAFLCAQLFHWWSQDLQRRLAFQLYWSRYKMNGYWLCIVFDFVVTYLAQLPILQHIYNNAACGYWIGVGLKACSCRLWEQQLN